MVWVAVSDAIPFEESAMNTEVRFERRPMQRFALHLPVSVRLAGADRENSGYTQDLSARGVLFYTDLALAKADAVELTFIMPAEITLAETMRMRCRGKVVRVATPAGGMAQGVAVRIEGYEFLPEPESLTHRSESFRTPTVAPEAAPDQDAGASATGLHSTTPALP
jgi:PilZ domain